MDVGREERKKTIIKYYKKYPSEFSIGTFLFLLTNLRRLYRLLGLQAVKILYYKKALRRAFKPDET
jgi:hypothetical protein